MLEEKTLVFVQECISTDSFLYYRALFFLEGRADWCHYYSLFSRCHSCDDLSDVHLVLSVPHTCQIHKSLLFLFFYE